MTTPAPDLTRRERAAIARLLRAADTLSEPAQRVLEGQMAVREREVVRWAGDAQRAGVARPLFPPEVYVRVGIPVEFPAPRRPDTPTAPPSGRRFTRNVGSRVSGFPDAIRDSRIPGFLDAIPRRARHRGMAARIRPGRRFVLVHDITDASTRLVALDRLRPVTFPRPAYAIVRRYLRLVEQGRFAAGRPQVWMRDDLGRSDAWKRLSQRDRRAVARILGAADVLSEMAQRELWRAFAARERLRLRGRIACGL